MEKLGIEILSCNIQNVTDEKGLINDLGADNTSKIKKDAAIAKAQADRDVAIAQAEANKAANDARVQADTEIAQKNNELAIRQSELKVISDTKKAEADAAYEIQKQAQEKNIQIATVNAAIAKAERDSELKKQEVAVMQQALDAEINKKADAEKYRVEQAAAAALARERQRRESTSRSARQRRERLSQRLQSTLRSRRQAVSARSTKRRQAVLPCAVRRRQRREEPWVLRKLRPWKRRPRLTRSTTMPQWRRC